MGVETLTWAILDSFSKYYSIEITYTLKVNAGDLYMYFSFVWCMYSGGCGLVHIMLSTACISMQFVIYSALVLTSDLK